MSSDLENKIVKQIEYYFGDINLPKDKFMQTKMNEDEGWITLEVLLTFKRLANLSSDSNFIINALEKINSELIEISEDKKKLRRNPDLALPQLNDERKKELMTRTAYAKGFPVDEDLTDIIAFLEKFSDSVESVLRRTTKEHKFKGSCFIIFKDSETCKKFIEAESMKYKDVELIRKWQEDYLKKKREQYEQICKNKKEKQLAKLAKEKKELSLPKGTIIHFSGIPEDKTLTWEEIKGKIEENDFKVSFIDFKKGDQQGYVRLSNENGAVTLLEKLGDEIEVSDVKIKIRVLKDDEEDEFLKQVSKELIEKRKKQKTGKGKKRKGFGNSNKKEVKITKTK